MRQHSLSYGPRQPEGELAPQRDLRPVRTVPASAILAVSLLVVMVVWKALVVVRNYPAFVLPAPDVVLRRLIDELSGGTLLHHTGFTLAEALIGFALALAASLVLGYFLAHAPRLERVLAPQL